VHPGPTCLDDLINKETKLAAMGDRAKAFKVDLVAFQTKAKAALQDYTHKKYRDLLQRWIKVDADIVEFIRKLACAIPCWWCVVECEICPLLYCIRDMQRRLNGTGARYTTVDSLQDLLYWWTRERDARKERFDRITAVMSAWEKPAATIDKVLTDNATFIQNAPNVLAANTATLLWDLFFRVIPMHMAIAPPADVQQTQIDAKYLDLCACDEGGKPDDCCGPNLGPLSLRDRLNGPQPFLIHPSKYVDLICCLATTRYHPSKEAWSDADSEVTKLTQIVTTVTADIAAKTASLAQDAKARLIGPIDCRFYKPNGDGDPPYPGDRCCGDDR
jgi:hypothetical protein